MDDLSHSSWPVYPLPDDATLHCAFTDVGPGMGNVAYLVGSGPSAGRQNLFVLGQNSRAQGFQIHTGYLFRNNDHRVFRIRSDECANPPTERTRKPPWRGRDSKATFM